MRISFLPIDIFGNAIPLTSITSVKILETGKRFNDGLEYCYNYNNSLQRWVFSSEGGQIYVDLDDTFKSNVDIYINNDKLIMRNKSLHGIAHEHLIGELNYDETHTMKSVLDAKATVSGSPVSGAIPIFNTGNILVSSGYTTSDFASRYHDHNTIYFTKENVNALLAGKSAVGHTHSQSDIITFTDHTHTKSQIVDFAHTHSITAITDFDNTSFVHTFGTEIIAGNKTFSGITTFQNAVYITSTSIEVTDNEILLNKDETGDGVTAGTAGLRIKRGNYSDAVIRFNEANDLLEFGIGSSFTAVSMDGHTHDSRYYTETELTNGQLDSRYYTETEMNNGQMDSRYFTETEIGNFFEGTADGKKQVHWDRVTNKPAGVTNGYPVLDSNNKIPAQYLYTFLDAKSFVVTNSTERNALTALETGDMCYETATGDSYIYATSAWVKTADPDWANITIEWNAVANKPDLLLLSGGTMTGNIVMSGTSANIQLGTNFMSYDGTDTGFSINSSNEGVATVGFTAPSYKNTIVVDNLTASHYIYESGTDTVMRRKTLANVRAEVVIASDILTKIKTVDGLNSGLDADTVQGYAPSVFMGLYNGGGTCAVVNNVNLDNVTATCAFFASPCLVAPTGASTSGFVTTYISGNEGFQTYIDVSTRDMVYFRRRTGSAWKAWGEIAQVGTYAPYHGIETAGAVSISGSVVSIASGTNTYWFNGVKYTTASAITCDLNSDTVKDTGSGAKQQANKIYYVYFKDATGQLYWSTVLWNLKTIVPVATVYWNGSAGACSNEKHLHSRNIDTHITWHLTIGARYYNGLDLTYPNTANDGLLTITDGIIYDEDLPISILNSVTNNKSRIWYLASAGVYTWVNSTLPYAGTTNTPAIANGTGLTTMDSGKYTSMWVYASTDVDYPIYIFPHNAETNTVASARAQTPPALKELGLTPELKLIYRFIYKGDGQFQEASDYRTVSSLPSGFIAPTNAGSVVVIPSGDISSTNVQSALEELDSEKIAKSIYDAHTIVYATANDTPLALTVAEQTIVGRKTGGNINALTATEVRTILNVADGATAYTDALARTACVGTAITDGVTTTSPNSDVIFHALAGKSDTGHTHSYQASDAGLTSLAGLTYVSPAFVKMTGADTFTLDTTTYLSSIADESITNAKLAHIATSTIKGRKTASSGDVEDLSASDVRTILNVADGATAYSDSLARTACVGTAITDGVTTTSPNSDVIFHALAGKQASDSGLTSLAGLTYVSSAFVKMTGADTFTLDTTTYLSSIADESITNAKLAHVATSTIKGRKTALSGDVEDLSASDVRTILNVADGATAYTDALARTACVGTAITDGVTSTSPNSDVIFHALAGKSDTGHTHSYITASSADTLTNKTLTAPKFADGGYIADANGNELIKFVTTASAVNEITITNNASGYAPIISPSGVDTDININFICKGTGKLMKDTTHEILDADNAVTVTNKTLTAPKFVNNGYIADANGNELIKFVTTASAVNEITITNGATATTGVVKINATGGDTNIHIEIGGKGTGQVKMTTPLLNYLCTSNPTGVEGMQIYRTDLHKALYYNGSAWVEI